MKKINLFNLIIIILILIIVVLMGLCYLMIKENKNEIEIEYSQNYKEDFENIQIKEKYGCNEFNYITITTENLLRMYLNDYKSNVLNDIEKAYSSLNSEYRKERFENIDKYKEYINNNIEEMQQIKLDRYIINEYDDYQEYICIDQYNNFYIFEVIAVMNYNIKLDTYSILTAKKMEEYTKLSNIEKVGYNIQRCIDAINNEDYNYVYNKLDNTFKNNNFKTEEDFKNYIKNNFYKNNTIDKNIETSEQGNIYIYDITMKNADNNNEEKKITFIMQLKENTDFVMSFNIK